MQYLNLNIMNRIKESIEQSIEVKSKILSDEKLMQSIEDAVNIIVESLRNGGKIHFCGNGGSAADAQHLAAELSGRFYLDRDPLNAEALHCNSSYMTAVSNDFGYDFVYSRIMRASAKKGDVLVGISTSGNSHNIIEAYKTCEKLGVNIISLTGATGGMMKDFGGILINVPSNDTPRIQESHIMIGHIICELVEKRTYFK